MENFNIKKSLDKQDKLSEDLDKLNIPNELSNRRFVKHLIEVADYVADPLRPEFLKKETLNKQKPKMREALRLMMERELD